MLQRAVRVCFSKHEASERGGRRGRERARERDGERGKERKGWRERERGGRKGRAIQMGMGVSLYVCV